MKYLVKVCVTFIIGSVHLNFGVNRMFVEQQMQLSCHWCMFDQYFVYKDQVWHVFNSHIVYGNVCCTIFYNGLRIMTKVLRDNIFFCLQFLISLVKCLLDFWLMNEKQLWQRLSISFLLYILHTLSFLNWLFISFSLFHFIWLPLWFVPEMRRGTQNQVMPVNSKKRQIYKRTKHLCNVYYYNSVKPSIFRYFIIVA